MSPRIKKRGVSVVPGKKPRHILSQGGTGRQRNKKKASPKLKTKKLQILEKIKENPIISPRAEHAWEAWQTFNPAAILLEDHVHFLYRAIGPDGVSRVGYAASRDGVTIDERLAYPVYEHPSLKRSFSVASYSSGGSWGGAEDSRIVRVDEEDVLYMTYTACDNGLRVGLTSIKVDDFLNKKWKWKLPVLISPPGEVHKNWLIFPEKIHGRYAILHSIKPDIQVEYRDSLAFDDASYIESSHGGKPRKGCWDKWLRGAGAPPIKTKYGWLLLYHAMDNDWSKYKVGAMLLDLADPTRILCRAKEPILEPEESYENNGYKPGIVYVSGAVVKNGRIFVYYGGADSYVCVAHADLEEFLAALRQKEARPKLKGGMVKDKK